MAYDIPALRFPDDALEPYIASKALRRHHDEIHPAYLTALNALLAENSDCSRDTVEALLREIEQIPAPLRQQIAYLAGGHANHQFFWKILGPQAAADKPADPVGDLATEGWGFLTRLPQLGGHEAANPLIFGHWNIKGRHYRAPTGCGGWPSVRLGSAALAVAAMSCRVGSAEVRASCSAGCGAAGRGVGRRWSAGGHPPSGWWRTPR